jgi:hypothetical protein
MATACSRRFGQRVCLLCMPVVYLIGRGGTRSYTARGSTLVYNVCIFCPTAGPRRCVRGCDEEMGWDAFRRGNSVPGPSAS